jgi:ribose 5-phosphate isomerase B
MGEDVPPDARELSEEELDRRIEAVRRQLREQMAAQGPPLAARPAAAGPPVAAPPANPPSPTDPIPTAGPAPTPAAISSPAPPGRTAAAAGAAPRSSGQAVSARQLAPGADRRIAIGADHGGYELKCRLIELLEELRFEPYDVGADGAEAVDYPDFAVKVARAVARGEAVRGIMIDGAGIGSAMAANKVPGVRAATCHNEETAINSREHNNANVLVLGSGQVNRGLARRMVRIWLATDFAGGRHARRVAKIDELDRR